MSGSSQVPSRRVCAAAGVGFWVLAGGGELECIDGEGLLITVLRCGDQFAFKWSLCSGGRRALVIWQNRDPATANANHVGSSACAFRSWITQYVGKAQGAAAYWLARGWVGGCCFEPTFLLRLLTYDAPIKISLPSILSELVFLRMCWSFVVGLLWGCVVGLCCGSVVLEKDGDSRQ